jgi:hypothetical protein
MILKVIYYLITYSYESFMMSNHGMIQLSQPPLKGLTHD